MTAISGAGSPKRLLFILAAIMLPVLLLMGLTTAINAEPEGEGPICKQADNLVPNPGFEEASENPEKPYKLWEVAGDSECTYQRSSSAYEGNYAAQIVDLLGAAPECTIFTQIDLIPVEAGRTAHSPQNLQV